MSKEESRGKTIYLEDERETLLPRPELIGVDSCFWGRDARIRLGVVSCVSSSVEPNHEFLRSGLDVMPATPSR